MKIKLKDIKAATPRVRKELNLDKLDELAESIKETGGVIVPVKVRKNGKKYTCIYGHRRIEATRMAGLKEIEAFVADVDDAELLTQALIENVVREGMEPRDIAKALQQIKMEKECTNAEVASLFGWTDKTTVANYLGMLKPEFEKVLEDDTYHRISHFHIKAAKAGTDDDVDAVKVLEKAASEGLTKMQTRTVAEEYKRIKTGYGKKAAKKVLSTPYEKSGLQPFTPTRKPTPKIKETEGKILFQWIRDERVLLAEDGIKAISKCVAAINQSEEDRGGGKMVLKNLIERTEIVLNQMREVMDGYD